MGVSALNLLQAKFRKKIIFIIIQANSFTIFTCPGLLAIGLVRRQYRDDFCQLFKWFQLFSFGEKLPKVAEHMYSQNRSKMDHLKGGVGGLSYFFHWFSVILFSNQNLFRLEGLSQSLLYGSWIYLYNQCLLPLLLKLWVPIPIMARCTRYNIMC